MRRKCKELLLLLVFALTLQAIPVCAAGKGGISDEQGITPYMLYIVKAESNLAIESGGLAKTEAYIRGNSSVTKVSITANLQQYKSGKWNTIKTFSKSKESTTVSLSEEYSVTKGYTYRVQSTVTAYCGDASETKTVTSSEMKY